MCVCVGVGICLFAITCKLQLEGQITRTTPEKKMKGAHHEIWKNTCWEECFSLTDTKVIKQIHYWKM